MRTMGRLELLLGPMFAGRTVLVLKSNIDTRYSLQYVVAHSGAKEPCLAVASLSDVSTIHGNLVDKADVIGIDEAQFFPDLIEFCQNATEKLGKRVVVSGLDGDFLRRPFGQVLDLAPLADTVDKFTAECKFCGAPAIFTLRTITEHVTYNTIKATLLAMEQGRKGKLIN